MANAATATFSGRSIIWAGLTQATNYAVPKNIGWGTSAVTGSANSDVNLFAPATESRVAGTTSLLSTTQLSDTFQVTGTLTCLTGAKTITEAGLFDTTTLSPTTTIATSSMAAGATTVTLSAASGIAAVNYYRQIENEVVLVTAGQNTATETVTRSQLGSATAAHAIGAATTVGGDGGAHANAGVGGQTATVPQMTSFGGSLFAHADFTGVPLSIGDSILFTFKDVLS